MKITTRSDKRSAVSCLVLAGCVLCASAFAMEQPAGPLIHGEYALLGAMHRTGGSGEKALIRQGDFLTNELKLSFEDRLWDDWKFTADLHARQTTDPQTDGRKDLRLLGWTTELYNPFLRFTAGDFFAEMTQYTMLQAVSGAQVQIKTDTLELKGIGGYSQNPAAGQHFQRYVYGGRAETLIVKDAHDLHEWGVGLNFAGSEDDRSTLDTKGGVADASNRVGSINSHVAAFNTDIDGEFARSWSDDDTSPLNNVDRKTGVAVRVNSNTRFSKAAKARFGYEWVSADFDTLTGSAAPDRVNLTGRLDYKWNRELSSELGYRASYDKLEDSRLDKRTVTLVPRAAVTWQPASEDWALKDFYSRLYWEGRRRTSNDDGSGQIDFFSNEYGIEDEFALCKVNVISGWSIRDENDDFQKENTVLTNSGYLGVRTHERMFNADLMPSLRYHFDYDDLPKMGGHDLTQGVTAGLDADLSNGLKLEQRYSVETGSRLAHDADTVWFNVYLGVDYRIPVKEDLSLRVSYELVDLAHEVSTERFSENNFQTRLLWRF